MISDAHAGLTAAVAKVMSGASWQRCRVHFMRNVLTHVPKGDKSMAAAAIRTIFAQPTAETAHRQLEEVAKAMQPRWSKAAEVLLAGETRCSRIWPSRRNTGPASTPPTRWNG